jgi:hypothetical protein
VRRPWGLSHTHPTMSIAQERLRGGRRPSRRPPKSSAAIAVTVALIVLFGMVEWWRAMYQGLEATTTGKRRLCC